MKSNKDLYYLYKKYYLDLHSDNQTSSHWEKYGKEIKVSNPESIKTISDLTLKGSGFGDYKKINLLNFAAFFVFAPYYLLSIIKTRNFSLLKSYLKTLAKSGFVPTFDSLKNYRIIAEICKYLELNQLKNVVIIGDGYGFLGNFLKHQFPKMQIISINLGKVLYFDLVYYLKNFPNGSYKLIRDKSGIENAELGEHIYISPETNIFIEAENLEKLKNQLPKVDLFLNIASFQEMNLEIIHKYFKFMRSNQNCFIYLCNRERKVLPDKSVIEFSNYGWVKDDLFLFNEVCSWYKWFPTVRPPFIHKFDGKMRHALVKLKNE